MHPTYNGIMISFACKLCNPFFQRCPLSTKQVCERTAADKKGGHLAIRKSDGKFILRESAMCPDPDKAAFEDITKHKYFNTNNLWVNLPMLKVGVGRTSSGRLMQWLDKVLDSAVVIYIGGGW